MTFRDFYVKVELYFLWSTLESDKGKIVKLEAKIFEKPANADKITNLYELIVLLHSKKTSEFLKK